VEASSEIAAYDPERMRVVLQQHLQPSESASLRVQECRIANTRRRDGSRGTVQYDLRLEDPTTGLAWNQIVTGITFGGNRTRRAWDSIRRSAALDAAPEMRSGLPPFAYVPELDLLLQVFPHDYRLPALDQLIAGPPPELVPALIEEMGPGDWELNSWQAETVQYRVDMRAILRLTVGAADRSIGGSSERQFYAKIYRDVEQGRRAHRAQYELHEQATAVGKHLVVTKPIIYSDTLRTLVTGAIPGTSLSKIIGRGKGSIAAVQNAARAVAEFHKLEIAAPQRSLAEDMARLRAAQATIASARPDLAGEVGVVVQAVASGLESAPSSLIHGDLKPDHILIDGDRVALIDFDLYGAADPVVDIAHLLAFLGKPQERSRSRRRETENVGQVFVDEYFRHVPASWRARLPLHHATTSIHRAVSLCQRRGANHQHLVEDVLREGRAFLDREADGSVPSYRRRLTRSVVH
jgi:tRNA A-37 threonylcarbamoyl transferase component Bud32